MDNVKNKILSGLFWRYTERFSGQLIQFGVSIVLARILLPSDFGLLALNTIFIVIAATLADSGFASALIQRKTIDKLDCSSIFWATIIFSLLLYFIIFLFAPLISDFYEATELTSLLRVQSLIILLNSLSSVQNALLSREMNFKKSFTANIIGVITSGVVGISMAYSGFGVWSLVWSQLAARVPSIFILWFSVNWFPEFKFSYNRFKSLFSFSSKFLGVALINTIFTNIYSVIIGKKYNATTLGFYNRGYSLPSLIADNLSNTVGQVLLPALSANQDNKGNIKNISKKILVSISFILFFFLAILGGSADSVVRILFTEKWIESIPFLQISCVLFAFYPLNLINQVAMNSTGRSDLHLKYEIIKKIILVIILLITIPMGIYYMLLGSALSAFISAVISTIPNTKSLNYSTKEQLSDILPIFFVALLIALGIWQLNYLQIGILLRLIIQISIGTLLFVASLFLVKRDLMTSYVSLIKLFYSKYVIKK